MKIDLLQTVNVEDCDVYFRDGTLSTSREGNSYRNKPIREVIEDLAYAQHFRDGLDKAIESMTEVVVKALGIPERTAPDIARLELKVFPDGNYHVMRGDRLPGDGNGYIGLERLKEKKGLQE